MEKVIEQTRSVAPRDLTKAPAVLGGLCSGGGAAGTHSIILAVQPEFLIMGGTLPFVPGLNHAFRYFLAVGGSGLVVHADC